MRVQHDIIHGMSQTQHTEVTQLLNALRAGDPNAEDRLYPIVYDELRRAAVRMLGNEAAGHTLSPSDLVHEAWLRLGLGNDPSAPEMPASDRSHFLALTIRAMKFVLIDYARRRMADKRGAGAMRITLDDGVISQETSAEDTLSLFDAIEKLGEVDVRLRQVVEYRYLAGFTEDETASLLDVTPRTVQRDWVKARAWLHRQLYAADPQA